MKWVDLIPAADCQGLPERNQLFPILPISNLSRFMLPRSCARLVLVDERRRVLLFWHADGHGREFWATPGGGIEPGEAPEQTARREAAEELGADQVDLLFLWAGHSQFLFADRLVSQSEAFFLVTTHSAILGQETADVHRREGIKEARWWSVNEIESSEDLILPLDLSDRIREHLGL